MGTAVGTAMVETATVGTAVDTAMVETATVGTAVDAAMVETATVGTTMVAIAIVVEVAMTKTRIAEYVEVMAEMVVVQAHPAVDTAHRTSSWTYLLDNHVR